MMSAAKALGVLLAVAALLLAAPATAVLGDLIETVEERGGDALGTEGTDDPGTPSEADSADDTATDTIDQATDAASDAAQPVAIADVSVVADEVHHPYLCPTARDDPSQAHSCKVERTEDVTVADDRFDVEVTLTNPQDPPQPRIVTVVLSENGEEVARETVTMDVERTTYVYESYDAACDCYLPAGTYTDVHQDWVVDLDLGDGQVGSTYQVTAYTAPNLGAATDLAALPSDATGPFQAHASSASAGGADAASGAAAAGSGQIVAIVVATTGLIAAAGAVAAKRL